jgi:hypothetical protein
MQLQLQLKPQEFSQGCTFLNATAAANGAKMLLTYV